MQKNIKITSTIIEYFNNNDSGVLVYHFDEFRDILPENLKDIDDSSDDPLVDAAVEIIENYINDNITWVADQLDYYDLEDSYARYFMIFKHNGKLYGVAYSDSYDYGVELERELPIEEYPEFEEYSKPAYR